MVPLPPTAFFFPRVTCQCVLSPSVSKPRFTPGTSRCVCMYLWAHPDAQRKRPLRGGGGRGSRRILGALIPKGNPMGVAEPWPGRPDPPFFSGLCPPRGLLASPCFSLGLNLPIVPGGVGHRTASACAQCGLGAVLPPSWMGCGRAKGGGGHAVLPPPPKAGRAVAVRQGTHLAIYHHPQPWQHIAGPRAGPRALRGRSPRPARSAGGRPAAGLMARPSVPAEPRAPPAPPLPPALIPLFEPRRRPLGSRCSVQPGLPGSGRVGGDHRGPAPAPPPPASGVGGGPRRASSGARSDLPLVGGPRGGSQASSPRPARRPGLRSPQTARALEPRLAARSRAAHRKLRALSAPARPLSLSPALYLPCPLGVRATPNPTGQGLGRVLV